MSKKTAPAPKDPIEALIEDLPESGVSKTSRTTKNLSPEEKAFINSHAEKAEWTDKKIAKHLGRSEEAIKKYRRRNSMRRDGKEVEPAKAAANIQQQIENTEEAKRKFFKQKLMKSLRAPRLVKSLSPEDYEFFVDRWSEYHLQFTDMTSSEEDSLEKMVLLDIRLNHNQKNLRQCHVIQEKLSSAMSKREDLDPENERDLQILHTIEAYNSKELELNKEFRELSKEYSDLQRSLNATREQREANQKIGAETFFDLIKTMNDNERRSKAARLNELMKMSRNQKLTDLQEPHKFVDGQYDYPVMDGAAFKKRLEAEKAEALEKKEDKDE